MEYSTECGCVRGVCVCQCSFGWMHGADYICQYINLYKNTILYLMITNERFSRLDGDGDAWCCFNVRISIYYYSRLCFNTPEY